MESYELSATNFKAHREAVGDRAEFIIIDSLGGVRWPRLDVRAPVKSGPPQIDWRDAERDGRPAVEFTFDGMDEMTPTSDRGWAVINGETIDGMIFFHQGDKSGFTANNAIKTK